MLSAATVFLIAEKNMATEIQMAPMPSNSAETEHEIQEYLKIIKLRDEIYAGKHPRFKPASQPGSVLRSTAQPANSSSGTSADKNYSSGVSRSQSQGWPTNSAGQITESRISDILLSKSDVLVNAEIKLKRQRIEKELKRQVEEKRQVTIDEEDLNLEEVMEKVGLSATRSTRPGNEDMDMQTGEPAPRRVGVLEQEEKPEAYLIEALRKPPTGPAAMSTPREQDQASRHGDSEAKSHNTRDTIPERVYSPPARPHYSATSQLRSPAAPQPVRPANMARVESQDQRMIVEVDTEIPYGSAGRPPYRGRVSPVPYIKPEPASPGYREPVPRVQTPDRGRPPSRVGQYDTGSRARYEYPYVPPAGYYSVPPAPPLVPAHRPYDPYSHREADPYACPPAQIDYAARRSYTPAYVPPVASTYPPRLPYDEFDRRYPPPPPVPIRQPSRVGRRSASPPGPYRHTRHSSRSVSPTERGRRESPRPVNSEYRPQSRMPLSPPRIDQYGRTIPQPPSAIQQRGSEIYAAEYGHPYAPHRERPAYGDERSLYYQPQAPVHYNEPPRPESSIVAREAEVRSYRDREYSYSTAARQSLPPPPIIGGGYPPPPLEYARASSRAASRAPVGLPTEILDYPRGIGERGDYHDRPLARPDERERDHGGRTSARPDERGGYLPIRHASARPEISRGYGEREYAAIRQQSVRPDVRRDDSREQYMEPLPITGGFARDSGQMQPPPRLPYAGSEYGDSRYGRKY